MVESRPKSRVARLVKVQDKALSYIDNNETSNSKCNLANKYMYNVQALVAWWREHILSAMYHHSQSTKHLELDRPSINLQITNKVKFRTKR